MKIVKSNNSLSSLIKQIRTLVQGARENIARNINLEILQTYWKIGKHIVEYEQKGKERAGYGEQLIKSLSERLTTELGKGFTSTNLKYMRQFYLTFPKSHALRD